MIPRILSSSTDIATINYEDLSNYATLSDILEDSKSKEELHTGLLTLEFEYPCDGVNADKLVGDAIVLYKINGYEVPHAFIIDQVEKDSDNLTYSVFANSITYLADVDSTVYFELGTNATANDFINKLNTIGDSRKIVLTTDVVGTLPNGFKDTTLRNKVDLINSDSKDSFIKGFGGYLKRFKNEIKILNRRGSDRAEVIRYGENIINVSCDYDYSNVVTAVRYVCDENSDGNVVSSVIVYSPKNTTNTLNHLKTINVSKNELEKEFGYNIDLISLLNLKANDYFNSSENVDVDEPEVSLKVVIDEKKSVFGKLFENAVDFEFKLGDRVKLVVDKLGIDLTSEIVAIDYDGVREEIKEITFGKVKRYVREVYKEEFVAPTLEDLINDALNQTGGEIPSEDPEIPEIPQDNTLEEDPNSNLTKFTINTYELVLAQNSNKTTPKLEFTIINPNSDSDVIISSATGNFLGSKFDLIYPRLYESWPDNKIVNHSRAKYLSYSDGVITIHFNRFLSDVNKNYGSDLKLSDIEFGHIGVFFATKSAITGNYVRENGNEYWGFGAVTISGSGPVGDDEVLKGDAVSPLVYFQYLIDNNINLNFIFMFSALLKTIKDSGLNNLKALLDAYSLDDATIDTVEDSFNNSLKVLYQMHKKNPYGMRLISYSDYLKTDEYQTAFNKYNQGSA